MKKKILICYPAMMLGGSTTSLLSVLNRMDYARYEVSLLLDKNEGPWFDLIPKQVNVLPQAYLLRGKRTDYFRKFLSPRYAYHFLKSGWIAKKEKNAMCGVQYLESSGVDFYRTSDEAYDVAIAFLEGRSCKYVASKVSAKRKLAWIHIDYAASPFKAKYDKEAMQAFDSIVLVSDKCKRSFDAAFPELVSKTCIIENILSAEHIQALAAQDTEFVPDKNTVNLVTTCRISFASKGLDRAVAAMERLKAEGKLSKVHWYIIGDGPDREALEQMILRASLQEYITLLGMQINPYPYLKKMDLFFLPSRWEGKPMAVTEAFMLGLPALVTEYASAHEQVRDGVDGLIYPNSTEGIYDGLSYVLHHQDILIKLRDNVLNTDYSNEAEMQKIRSLIG